MTSEEKNTLTIDVSEHGVRLSIAMVSEPSGKGALPLSHGLENRLLTSLDKLLKKTNIKKSHIKLYRLQSVLNVESTAQRIVNTFAEAIIHSL